MDPWCKVVFVVMKMDYSHPSCAAERAKMMQSNKRGHQTVVIVPMPHPSVKLVLLLTVL